MGCFRTRPYLGSWLAGSASTVARSRTAARAGHALTVRCVGRTRRSEGPTVTSGHSSKLGRQPRARASRGPPPSLRTRAQNAINLLILTGKLDPRASYGFSRGPTGEPMVTIWIDGPLGPVGGVATMSLAELFASSGFAPGMIDGDHD